MIEVIGGGIAVLLALWFVIDVVKARRQSFHRAVRRVEREMARPQPPGKPSLVLTWMIHPLSEHMVKRIAELGGFRFLGQQQAYNGARALAFAPPKNSPKQKLSIHD
ncbi:hypothetical protein [Saccharomonospora halophila]|uniref:hypothetical protein n=1 Tax=Saccharomonospora halophila TaxID=129922 RepID=UPI00035DD33D|nr:hypothetical protein [Saccharomonospora halophila]